MCRRFKLRVFVASILFGLAISASAEELLNCEAFVQASEEAYKHAHIYKPCLAEADAGNGVAMYSVGMSYGFAGNTGLEIEYYRRAASKEVVASYFALGHALSEIDIEESIKWYEKYIDSKPDGYGYAALLASRLYSKQGKQTQAKYWLSVCKSSPYAKNCKTHNK